MATTTLHAILDHVRTICEGTSCNLTRSRDAFSHDLQPSALLSDTYYVEDGGVGRSVMLTNNKAARLDRLVIYVAALTGFGSATAQATMETTLLTLEQALIAGGPDQGYHVRLEGRRVTRPRSELIIGSVAIGVDYDVDLEAA